MKISISSGLVHLTKDESVHQKVTQVDLERLEKGEVKNEEIQPTLARLMRLILEMEDKR
jgi:hypothetical protein